MKIKDHNELFQEPVYQEQFQNKREFERPEAVEKVKEISDWTKTPEYRELNFSRKFIKINPAKACQPLGAVFCASGFARTMPFVQGAQGCVAYFRSHLNRHFKEPMTAISTSMTEDAAVFGGLANMLEGLENAYTLYKPDMIAVSTTCMAEVIGDDLNAYIKQAKDKELVPKDMPVPFAHTPSFVGSHLVGYDNMLKGILQRLTTAKSSPNGKLNIIPGFDTYMGNLREIKRMMRSMGVEATVLSDSSNVYDSPNTGAYEMYPGGTPLDEVRDAINASGTIAMQTYSTLAAGKFIETSWEQEFSSPGSPIGIRRTDAFLAEVSRMTGKPLSQELEDERGRAVDAMVDSHPYIHGKRFALVGDPDQLLGMISLLLEMGGEPVHIVCTNGTKQFKAEAEELLSTSIFGRGATVYINHDMWHLRSLMFTEPVDYLIGNSYAKFLWRDTKTPLIRFGFPLFDRHHLHRSPVIGYQGTLNLVTTLVNTVLEEMDKATMHTASFDVIR